MACQFLELALEVAAVGEAALAGDGLVRPVGMGGQQLFRFLYAQAVQPAGIVYVVAAEPCGELFTGDAHLARNGGGRGRPRSQNWLQRY